MSLCASGTQKTVQISVVEIENPRGVNYPLKGYTLPFSTQVLIYTDFYYNFSCVHFTSIGG